MESETQTPLLPIIVGIAVILIAISTYFFLLKNPLKPRVAGAMISITIAPEK